MRVISASVQRKCCASSNTSRPSEHCVLLKTQFRGIVQSAYKVCVPVQKKKKKRNYLPQQFKLQEICVAISLVCGQSLKCVAQL